MRALLRRTRAQRFARELFSWARSLTDSSFLIYRGARGKRRPAVLKKRREDPPLREPDPQGWGTRNPGTQVHTTNLGHPAPTLSRGERQRRTLQLFFSSSSARCRHLLWRLSIRGRRRLQAP